MKLSVTTAVLLLLATATASPFSNRRSTSGTKVDIDIHIADVPIAAVPVAGLQTQADEHGAEEQRLLLSANCKAKAKDQNVLTLSLGAVDGQTCADVGEWCQPPLTPCCGEGFECRENDMGEDPKCVAWNEL